MVVALAALLAAGCGGSAGPKGPPALVFVSVKEGDYAIYGADADGKHTYRLTDHQADPSTPEGLFWQNDPAWSPDGSEIAFTSNRDGRTHVFVMNADGTGTRRVTKTQHSDEHPTWSPDGRWIVFAREGAIYRVRESGGAARRVGSGFGAAADPAYSPDGRADRLRLPAAGVLDQGDLRDERRRHRRPPRHRPPRRQQLPPRGRRTARPSPSRAAPAAERTRSTPCRSRAERRSG